jgi:signal transduction histidine kinase
MPVSLEIAELFVERDRLHASLRQAQKMETVGQIAGGIAHDFSHMLSAIQSSLHAIRDRSGRDPGIDTETEAIEEVTKHAGRLMRQLLTYARQQGGEQTRFTVNDRIGRLKPMLQRLAGERVTVVLKLDPEVGAVTLGESAFVQAMVNLVVNARDAMPTGGTLTIATREAVLGDAAARRGAPSTGPHVHVEVTDTGQGISPEHVRQVFDPFFTTKPAGSGTGIGLTTVYAFVRNTGGHVEVTSTVGRGTTLSMFFPTEEARPVEQASGRARETAPSAGSAAAGAPRLARIATPASR